MAVKITCDICGKEITERTDATLFYDYQFCERCYKAIEPKRKAWQSWKHYAFVEFFADEIDEIKKGSKLAKKVKPAPHTHVCKCQDGKPVAVETVAQGKCKCRKTVRKPVGKKVAKQVITWEEAAAELEKKEDRKKKICGSGDLAKELGRRVSTISHYATANNIGKLKGTVRVYNVDEADRIRKHFGR